MRALLIAVLAALSAAMPAHSQTYYGGTMYWDVDRYERYCGLRSTFRYDGRSEMLLLILYQSDGGAFSLSSDEWTASGRTHNLVYRFISRAISREFHLPSDGVAIVSRGGFATSIHDDFLAQFSDATQLIIMLADDPTDPVVVADLDLEGSASAVDLLRSCFTEVASENSAQAEREARWDYIERDPFRPEAVETDR